MLNSDYIPLVQSKLDSVDTGNVETIPQSHGKAIWNNPNARNKVFRIRKSFQTMSALCAIKNAVKFGITKVRGSKQTMTNIARLLSLVQMEGSTEKKRMHSSATKAK